MLYKIIPLFLGIIIVFLGAFMSFFPRLSTRADKRDDPSAVSKSRVSGIVMFILGIAVVVLRIIYIMRF